jgi:transposase
MRLSISEKQEIIRLVDRSELVINRTLKELGIHKSTFCKWYQGYHQNGPEGLLPQRKSRRQWNSIPESQKQLVVELALDYPDLSPRELSVKLTDEQKIFISESSVYRILKAKGLISTPAYVLLSASGEFKKKTHFVHEMWQTDFTYFKILGWGWYYLSTVLDDYSRYIVHWELCKSMKAGDVERTLDRAIVAAGLYPGQRTNLPKQYTYKNSPKDSLVAAVKEETGNEKALRSPETVSYRIHLHHTVSQRINFQNPIGRSPKMSTQYTIG